MKFISDKTPVSVKNQKLALHKGKSFVASGFLALSTQPPVKKKLRLMFLASCKWLLRSVGKMNQQDDVLGDIKLRAK